MSRARRRKKRSRLWGKRERLDLLTGVGAYGWIWFEQRFPGRSQAALRAKLQREVGSGSFTRGAYTRASVANNTGYSIEQLKRAQEALGQKWHRLSARGPYIITEEQVEDLCRWLRHDYWSVRHHRYSCCWCAGGDRPPFALGFCRRCYYSYRRLCARLLLPSALPTQLRMVQFLRQSLHDDKVLANLEARLAKGVGADRSWLFGLTIRAREWRRENCDDRRTCAG